MVPQPIKDQNETFLRSSVNADEIDWIMTNLNDLGDFLERNAQFAAIPSTNNDTGIAHFSHPMHQKVSKTILFTLIMFLTCFHYSPSKKLCSRRDNLCCTSSSWLVTAGKFWDCGRSSVTTSFTRWSRTSSDKRNRTSSGVCTSGTSSSLDQEKNLAVGSYRP